jgi:hypothetical protein
VVQLPLQFVPSDSLALKILMMHSLKTILFGSSQYTSIAEALRISKNSNPNSATNVVFYLGDPA